MPRLSLVALAVLAVLPAAAAAAPPANDNRAAAQSLDPLPTTVQGTTAEATREDSEFGSSCTDAGPSVWYAATAAQTGRIGVRAEAGGDLDYSVDVFKRVRSQLSNEACDSSDGQGRTALSFRATQGDRLLIRVTQRENSVAGTFALHVSAPFTPAPPPGTPLPPNGATRTPDRPAPAADPWPALPHSGVPYRVRPSGPPATRPPPPEVYLPGTTAFDDASPAHDITCGRSLTFTPRPGEGGRYTIRVAASSSARRPQGYHLQVARAGL